MAGPQSGRNFDPSERGTFRILSLPKSSDAQTPHRRSDPCSYALLDVFRASPRGHPWLDAPSPRFGPKADRVRAAPQPAANAASSADPHFIGTLHLSAGQTLGHAAQIHRLPTPSRALCLETHQTRPYRRATIAPSVYARGLGSKVDVLSLGGSPSRPACRRPGLRSAFTHLQHAR